MRGWVMVVLALLLSFPAPAIGQYFGRNKVQYEKFDFKVLTTEHFDIYYYPDEEAAVRLAARMAERWYARLSKLMQHELRGRQPLILYAAHPHFQQTNVLSGDTDHVLGRELVHAFQYDLAAQTDMQGRLADLRRCAARLPALLHAGTAIHICRQHLFANDTPALGFAIAEFDYVRPFDRTNRGWIWQFGLTPGF